MILLWLGCLSFLIFIIYDINQIKMNYTWIRPFFSIGCLMLFSVTARMIFKPFESDKSVSYLITAIFIILALINLLLLLYTLFFAIPFYQAYIEGTKQKLCTEGVYSLSRHPGVLFLCCFYLFLGLALGKPFILLAGAMFTLMNLFYVFLQDKYFFPRSFDGYDDYRHNTTFVLPSRQSIKDCLRYYI